MITNLLSSLARNADPEALIKSSIKDYHVKGFDYICLHRSDDLTVKIYFFDGEVKDLPELVNPHDHRYDFDTFILRGQFTDFTFQEGKGDVFQKFNYKTPLLGGDGFTWDSEIRLETISTDTRTQGQMFSHKAEDFHTIRLDTNGTVLCLLQYADRPNLENTWTFSRDKEPPSLSGLYNEFTADQIIKRLDSIGL